MLMSATNSRTDSFIDCSVCKIAFYLFWLLKPLYLLPSGSFQIGDVFLIISFFFACLENKSIPYSKKDKFFLLFVVFTILINSIYCYYYYFTSGIMDFYKTDLFYLFNLFAILTFRYLQDDKKFLEIFGNICILNTFVQLFGLFLPYGKYFATIRYMGTYNDPNQFGFAILTNICIIFCITKDKKKLFTCGIISLFLIFLSGSSGMLLTFIILIMVGFFYYIKYNPKYILLGLVLSILLFFLYIYCLKNIDLSNFRIEEKIKNGSVISSFIVDRNIDLAITYKECFIYGAGEGFFTRFENNTLEIHSTWIGLLFYYGILPFLCLIIWIYKSVKNVKPIYMSIYIALFIEAATLANQRQPSFWIIIALACCLYPPESLDI